MKYILEEVDNQQTSFVLSEANPATPGPLPRPVPPTPKGTVNNVVNDARIAEVGWEQLYKNASTKEDLDKFWKFYYEKEWGANTDKIKKLGEAFKDELINLGFDNILNPFITYLKENNSNKLDWFTRESYTALHNAVVNKLVTLDDIKGIGKFKKENLIFNKPLFSLSEAEVTEYLSAQKILLNSGAAFIGEAAKTWSGDPALILKNIMLENGTLEVTTKKLNLELDSTQLKTGMPIALSNLKPILQIKQILKLLFGSAAERTLVTNSIIDANLNKAGVNKNNDVKAKQILSFLIIYFYKIYGKVLAKVDKKLTGKKFADIASDPAAKYTAKDWVSFVNDLQLNADYTDAQVEYMLLKLAEFAGIYTPTQPAP